MTFGTATWKFLRMLLKNRCFMLLQSKKDNYRLMENIPLYVHDALQLVRGTTLCNKERTEFFYCDNVLKRIAKHVLGILCNTGVQTYVFCLDERVVPAGFEPPVGQIEKAHTRKCRAKQNANAPALPPLPEGRESYFVSGEKALGDMNMICSNKRAFCDLYAYVTEYFCSDEFRSCIPEGKRVILSGGLGLDHGPLFPLVISRDEEIDLMTDMKIAHLAEGDLDVIRWMLRFPGDVVVESGDGDVLLHCLIQSRNVARLSPKRRVYYRTQRAAASKDIAESLPPKEVTEASSSSSSASSSKRKRAWKEGESKKVDQYVDIMKMRRIVLEASVSSVENPLEDLVVVIMLAIGKHDYFYRKTLIHNVGEEKVLLGYLKWQHKIGSLVSVFAEKNSNPSAPHVHVYRINREAVNRFVEYCYYTAVADQWFKSGKIGTGDLESIEPISVIMEKARTNRTNAFKQKRFQASLAKDCGQEALLLSCETRFGAGCAQLAWCMAYSGNNPIQSHPTTPGTATHTETGSLLYGYTSDGFNLDVHQGTTATHFECG